MNQEKNWVTSVFAWKKFKFLGFFLGKNGTDIFYSCAQKRTVKSQGEA